MKWGGGWFYGSDVNINPDVPTPAVANFWFRWPSSIPDPDNQDDSPEEDTWIKCLSTLIVAQTTGGASQSNPLIVCAGLIAWDAIDPIDFGLTTGIFPPPTEHNWDWIWRSVSPSLVTNTGQGQPTSLGNETSFVSKAMRKLPPSTGVVGLLTFQSANLENLLVSWSWDVRFAVKVER